MANTQLSLIPGNHQELFSYTTSRVSLYRPDSRILYIIDTRPIQQFLLLHIYTKIDTNKGYR